MERKKFLTNSEKEPLDYITYRDNWNLVGSQKDPNIIFTADYDVFQYLDNVDLDDMLSVFSQKLKKLSRYHNIYLGDIKTEISFLPKSKTKKPFFPEKKIRWSKEDVIKKNPELKDQLKNKNVFFKIDFLVYLPFTARFHEFTNVMVYQSTHSKNDMSNNLLKESEELKNQGKYYKSAKRMYSYYKLKNQKSKANNLLSVLNKPDLGILHQIREAVDALIYLRENHKLTTKSKRFRNDLESIKNDLWKLSNKLDSKALPQLVGYIENPTLTNLNNMEAIASKALQKLTALFLEKK